MVPEGAHPNMTPITIETERVLECARALVRVPSENPPGDTAAAAGEAERWCRDAGLDVQRFEPVPGFVNVVAVLDSGRPGKTLAFNGHLDVVPAMAPELWTHPPYEGAVRDGVLHGRGSCDMKGAIAAAIEAARALGDTGAVTSGKLVLQLVADEEVFGPHGSVALRDAGLAGADAAIVGEPTDLRVGIAQRGLFWTRITCHGVAAHGSTPDLGVSAIEAAARVVLALRTQQPPRRHALLGSPTANIGVVRGGAKINIVPATCSLDVDMRVMPHDERDVLVAELREVIDAIEPTVKADVEVLNFAPGYEMAEGEGIVRLALEAHEAVLGRPTETTGMLGATDAAVLTGAGVPAIVFGPGSLTLAHTTDEHVGVEELVDAARVYAWMAQRFLAGD